MASSGSDISRAYIASYLNGTPACFLLDSGSSTTLLSADKYYKIPRKYRPPLKQHNVDVHMADGASKLHILGIVSMPVRIHGTQFEYEMIVTSMKGVDGIWGTDFMRRFKVDLKMSSRTYVFNGKEYPLESNKHNLLPHSVSLLTALTLPPGSEVVLHAKLRSPFRSQQEIMLEPNAHLIQNHNVLLARSVTMQSRRRHRTPVQLYNPMDHEITLPKDTILGYAFPANTCDIEEDESSDNLDGSGTTDSVSGSADCFAVGTSGPEEQLGSVEKLERLEDDIPEHLVDLYEKSSVDLDPEQKQKLASLLIKYGDTFSSSPKDIGCTDLISHEIDTGNAKPIRVPLRRQGYMKEQEIKKAVQDGLGQGIMEESKSSWASAPVIVKKKDGTSRFCVDFRPINAVTKVDGYPIPRFDECIDSLYGSKFFCSLDLQAGYWQVPLKSQEDREKTAFLTKDGLFQFKVLAFGLCNAPRTFERLMECVLRGLQWEKCILYLDDVLVYGRTFEETLNNLEDVLKRMRKAKLKMKPSKCLLFQTSIEFLGHILSQKGIEPMTNKVNAVKSWPSPASVPQNKLRTEVKRFLGLVSYYRRFIRNMSQIAAPLYRLLKKNSSLIWTTEHESSFMRLKAALTSAPLLSYPDIRQGNFILDTDASNTGVGGVLSQVQDDKERVIGFYSHLLSDSERRYCITKREFLGVIKSVQHFKPYLYGQKFLIRTDNAAVSHLLTLTDAQEQIQRWQLFMSQFSFDIIHRPGRHHLNADFMSRVPCQQCGRKDELPSEVNSSKSKGKPRRFRIKESVDVPPCPHTRYTDESLEDAVDTLMMECAVTTRSQAAKQQEKHGESEASDPSFEPSIGDLVPLSEMHNLQISDPDISPILQLKLSGSDYPDYKSISGESLSAKAIRQHWRHLAIDDGILYRKLEIPDKPTRMQLVLPRTLKHSIMEKLHCDPCSGHLGTQKTLERVKAKFFWVGWRKDVMRFVSHCKTCNIMKHPHRKTTVPLTQQLFGEAFERVSVDIIGPLKRTPRGFEYVLTMEDNFTKWVEAAPLRSIETPEVCNAIIRELISRFGCMYIIHSDRGPQFISELYDCLLKKLGIDKSLTTPYNPKSNGLIENFNKILKSMMKTYIYEHKESVGDWDLMLPMFLMAYRSSVHSSTGETPHYLLTAREMKIPIDLIYSKPSESQVEVPHYIRQLEDRFHKAYSIARNHLKLAQRRQKKQFEPSSFKYKAIKPGDFVWYFNPRKTFKGDKHLAWKGPYLVKDVGDDFTVTLQLNQDGATYRTHCDKLRVAKGITMDNWSPK